MLMDRRDALAMARSVERAAAMRDADSHGGRPARVGLPGGDDDHAVAGRWAALGASPSVRDELLGAASPAGTEVYGRNVENFIGTVRVPLGVAGPLRVNGAHARGDFYVPLATTEATLIASHNRGARVIAEAGGCTAVTLSERVSRAPGFVFETLREAGQFVSWAVAALPVLRRVAEETSRYAQLVSIRPALEGNRVYLVCDFTCGDAAGQNMVTIATAAVCEYITRHAPVAPRRTFLETNHSGDKKASALSFLTGRGRSVCADVWIPADVVEARLHTTPDAMAEYWTMSAVGSAMSGTIGLQGHYANGLAALFLACGQDVACVAESSVGVTRMEASRGGLYATVTLPSLVVGTVGGGTGLPSQQACLELLGLAGPGCANAFAEVCAAVALAGELSIIGALCAGEFAAAHEHFARGASRGDGVGSAHV
jgi:hydroxymethylglutaryl-CoA reductase (NADPH)